MDDTAGQAYVEQFAQETLDRAERVIKAGKVTGNTANTFDAALTFFNLVNIWGPPDGETQQKIKYAKWNAARIIKAIKEGKDPNESNPKKEDLPPDVPALDPNDPEVQSLAASSTQGPRPATVEDAPDRDAPAGDVPRDDAGVSLPHSPASAINLPSAPVDGDLKLPSAPGYEDGAAQPGYFDPPPSIPSPVSPPAHNPVTYHPTDPPTAPRDWAPTPPPAAESSFPAPSGPSIPSTHQPASSPAPAPPTFATSPQQTPAVAPAPISPPPANYMNMAPTANVSRPVVPPPSIAPPTFTAPGGFSQVPQQVQGNFVADDMAMSQAQKHAKWAISALNFEDVPTAVRELRRALEALGAN